MSSIFWVGDEKELNKLLEKELKIIEVREQEFNNLNNIKGKNGKILRFDE